MTVELKRLLGRLASRARWAAILSALSYCVLVVPALGAETHLPVSAFGPEGVIGPSFGDPSAVAIDPSSEDIYVGDRQTEAIYKFDNAGVPLPFTGSASNLEGNKLSGTNLPAGKKESQLAVSPLNGTLVWHSYGALNAYEPDGDPLLFSAGPGSGTNQIGGFSELLGLAFDTAGNIYAADYSTETISVFSPSGALITTAAVGFHPANVAVAPTGTLYAVNYSGGVQKLTPSVFPVTSGTTYTNTGLIDSENATSVAVDPASEDVFTTFSGIVEGAQATRINQYTAAGALVSTFSQQGEIGALTEPAGIAAVGQIVATDRAGDKKVTIFGPLVTVPTVETLRASPVGPETATLRGLVNPEGAPVTSCIFEYGTSETLEGSASIPCAETAGEVGQGEESVEVHADVSGLSASTQYFYRLNAENAAGPARGKVLSSTTPRSPISPIISEVRLLQVGATEAVVTAQLDSGGLTTTYSAEFGQAETYGQSTPAQTLNPGNQAQSVTVLIKGLIPLTAYHFRLVATNSLGTAQSEDQSFRTSSPSPVAQICPNAAFRLGAGERLADCRAFEMVTPIDKSGIDIEAPADLSLLRVQLEQASSSGERLTFTTSQGFSDPAGLPYAPQYLSSREAGGWNTRSLASAQTGSLLQAGGRTTLEYLSFTRDLCVGAFQNYSASPLASGAAAGYPNLYKQPLCGSGALEGLTPSYVEQPTPNLTLPPVLGGMSSDGACAVYFPLDPQNFLPSGGDRQGILENCSGVIRQVNLLPNGEESDFAYVGFRDSGNQNLVLRNSILKNAVSEDGETIYWAAPAANGTESGPLFVRVNSRAAPSQLGSSNECLEVEKACTIPVSDEIEPGRRAFFESAAADGQHALWRFRDGPLVGNLYEFDLESGESVLVSGGAGRPEIPGTAVMGASDDGSIVYFVSTEALTGPAVAGNENLYSYNRGSGSGPTTRFVADLGQFVGNIYKPVGRPNVRLSRVTPDGLHVVFATQARLTDYDNRVPGSGAPVFEVYSYDAVANGGAGRISCVSCDPTGRRPTGSSLSFESQLTGELAAGVIPPFQTSFQGPRAITDDGTRIFFESFEPLVPLDTNGKPDVYQWTQEGVGGCSAEIPSYSPIAAGCLALISSGQGADASRLVDATANGSDVFFATAQSLVPQDPGLIDIYDARTGGGFPLASSPSASCEGEACQLRSPTPPPLSSGTSQFNGPGNKKGGNRKHCRKGKAGGKRKCQKKKNQKQGGNQPKSKRVHGKGGSK